MTAGRLLVTIMFAALPFCGSAEGLDTLRICANYTTHIMFPSELKYVDISNQDLVLGAIVETSRDVLALRADVPFTTTLSVSALESNQTMHTFIVVYDDNPKELVHDLRRVTASVPDRDGGAARNLLIEDVHGLPRRYWHLGDRQYGITAMCENVTVNNDMLYVTLSLDNSSGISYATEDAVFKIESRKTPKKGLAVNDRIMPKNRYGTLSAADGQTVRKTYSFSKFTLAKDQCLNIYIFETDGQRNLRISLGYRDVNGSR